jgi:hypothetical protein
MAANGVLTSASPKTGGYIALWILEGILLVFWVGAVLSIAVFAVQATGLLILWGIGILIMVIMLGLAGHKINERWTGALIDSRNKFSLSRLQITLWTILVLSAYLAVAMLRVLAMIGEKPVLSQAQALDIRLPEQLILAMGISAASFAGADIIKSNKKKKTLQIEAKPTLETLIQRLEKATEESKEADVKGKLLAQDQAKTKEDRERVFRDRAAKKNALQRAREDLKAFKEEKGRLHLNTDPSQAEWVDLLRGEEIGNHKSVDMAKVQMLFFTVIVIAAYAAAISSMLLNTEAVRTDPSLSFPDFASSLNTLLAISHGTYLSVKRVDHS